MQEYFEVGQIVNTNGLKGLYKKIWKTKNYFYRA